MKQKLQILTSILFSLFLSTSCIFMDPAINGNGKVVEETRKVEIFNEIKVSRGMNVYISQGEQTKVLVKADENLLDIIETDVEGDALIISAKQNIRKASSKKVYVTVPKITKIQTSSGSNVFSETVIDSKNLELSSSSGSNITLELKTNNTDASSSSGANMKLKGSVHQFSGKASSGSNLKANELISENCEAKVSSGANIWIAVHKNLNAHASSGGNIFYSGKANVSDIKKSSGGNVIKK